MNWAQVWLIIRKLCYLGPLWPMILGLLNLVAGEAVILTSSFTENYDLGRSIGIPLQAIGGALMLTSLFWMGMANRMEKREAYLNN